MKIMSTRLNIIIALITLVVLAGCRDMLDTERPPLLWKGHGVKLQESPSMWSRDYGPERSGHFRSLTMGDFNNDGKTDIIGGSYEPGAIFLWYGDDFGNWERIQRFKIKGDIRALDVGDINEDGWLDVISCSQGDTNGVFLWINENGHFSKGHPIIEKELYNGAKIADINNDRHLDIVAANKTSVGLGGISVWLGNGKGYFSRETGPTRRFIYNDVDLGDFNNDGKLDIAGAAWGADGGGIRVWLGTGDGRWSAVPLDVDKGSFWGVDVGDVDGDSNPDIISAANFEGVKIYFGDGKGDFSRREILAETGNFWRAKAVDLNNDGLLDIASTLIDDNGVILWYQTRNGNGEHNWLVAKDESLPKKGFYYDIGFADFNADNKLDIATATYGEGIKIWLREIDELVQPDIVYKLPVPVFDASVFFDIETEVFAADSMSTLNNVSEVLNSVEGTVLTIKKHAISKSANHHTLSEKRIKAVTDFFLAKGISQERIEIDVQVSNASDVGKKVEQQNSEYNSGLIDLEPRVDIAVNYGKSKDSKQKGIGSIDVNNAPFAETGDLVPVAEYKVWKEVNGVPEYRVGPGDALTITFWIGLEEKEYEVIVSPQNTVSFSYVKNFEVSGLTRTEMEEKLTEALKKVIKNPFIKVAIKDGDKHAYTASIFGAVRAPRNNTGPGTYPLFGKENFTQYLSRVGGHMANADLTRVQLTRNKNNYYLNIYDALFRSDFRQDVLIDAGDVFFIPSKSEIKNRVFVLGEVGRPGLFSFDQNVTLLDAVISAGGPTVFSKPRNVLVIRGDIERPEVTKLNLMDIVRRGDFRQNVKLNNGDVVYVARNLLGDLQNFVRAFGPFLAVASLPSNIYNDTAIPRVKDFPFQREPAPAVQTIITQPRLPQTAPPWGSGTAD